MIPFQNKFEKGFGHINPIAVIDKVDTSNHIVFPIVVIRIEIVTDVGT